MAAPPTPMTPRSSLGSPISTSSTLVNGLEDITLRKRIDKTPLTPRSSLGSPISTSSTLVNGLENTTPRQRVDKGSSALNASLVLQKLEQVLEPDEFEESVGRAPNIVVIGRESVGKSSVLNALTDIPLYIAAKTATRGPVQIATMHTPGSGFRATIQIETTSLSGIRKRHVFVEKPITMMGELEHAMYLAGNEARRFEVVGIIRPYTEINQPSRLTSDADSLPAYTMNMVILKVSGQDHINLHLTDLPGLGTAQTSQAVKNMLSYHITKPQNIIVHCIAACGGSPNYDECIRLNVEADPTGERTMIILTQVDRIDDPTDDTWTDMITGDLDPFEGWRPQLGVFPVRLAGPKERKEGKSALQIRELERSLFSTTDWTTVRARAKSDAFGIPATRAKLMSIHEDRVAEWLADIPRLLQSKQSANNAQIASLPSLPDNHIAALHTDIIRVFASKLHHQVTAEGPTYHRVVSLQSGLIQSMRLAIPLMIPLFKKDAKSLPNLRYEGGQMVLDEGGEQARIWIDDLLQDRKRYKNMRRGTYDHQLIMKTHITQSVKAWEITFETHVSQVWEAVIGSCEQLAKERMGMAAVINSALRAAKDDAVAKTRRWSEGLFAIAFSDPGMTGVPDENRSRQYRSGLEYAKGNFTRLYRNSTEVSDRLQVPEEISSQDIDAILELQSEIDGHLGVMCWTHGTILGQIVQVNLLSFLDDVESILREAFELDQVKEAVRKRTRDLFETPSERSKRAKLMEKASSLTDIENIVRSLT